MEKLFSLEYGVGGVCIILTIHLLVRLGEFLWRLREKKDSVSDIAIENLTKSIMHLDARIKEVEPILSELPKLKLDLRRAFTAVKLMSGEEWSDLRKQIMEDDLP